MARVETATVGEGRRRETERSGKGEVMCKSATHLCIPHRLRLPPRLPAPALACGERGEAAPALERESDRASIAREREGLTGEGCEREGGGAAEEADRQVGLPGDAEGDGEGGGKGREEEEDKKAHGWRQVSRRARGKGAIVVGSGVWALRLQKKAGWWGEVLR